MNTMIGPSPELIAAIRHPSSLQGQLASLKHLKNEINGHDQRKEVAVRHAIVEPLVHILAAPAKAAGKRNANGTGAASSQSQPVTPVAWTIEHDVRLEATVILSSLASGGPTFVPPLLAAGLSTALLHVTDGDEPPKLVTATLRTLKNLTASATLCDSSAGDTLIPQSALEPLLIRSLTVPTDSQQQKLAVEIIALLAQHGSIRMDLDDLADSVLDTLANLLVSSTVANRYFDYRGPTSHLYRSPPDSLVPVIMRAISYIIDNSTFRAQSFILSPPLRDFFSSLRSNGVSHNGTVNPFSRLLPRIDVPMTKSVSFNSGSSAFPPSNDFQVSDSQTAHRVLADAAIGVDASHSNDIVKWLIHLARKLRSSDRLAALELLAHVNRAIDAGAHSESSRGDGNQRQRERERHLGLLAVPLVVQLAAESMEPKDSPFEPLPTAEVKSIKEEVCDVLALLIEGSKELQVAAADASAIKRVCAILKQSFDTISIARPIRANVSQSTGDDQPPETCTLGPYGLPSEIRHAMRCRQAALEALSALARKEESHRKSIIDTGAMSCIIDSMRPLAAEFAGNVVPAAKTPPQFTAKDGNTVSVIIAACHAAQTLSRSVNLLRTSLIDAGLAKPAFALLTHSEREVQINATNMCCNLLLEFSSMRDELVAAGVVKILTEHTRQSEMTLRLASLWALKHLVLNNTREIKVQCLEELGTGWLVGAIQGEQGNAAADLLATGAGGVSIAPAAGLSTANAAGEQVDLLNPSNAMDVDEQRDEDEALDDEEDEDGEVLYDEAADTHYQASGIRSTLHRLRDTPYGTRPSVFNSSRYLSSIRELERNPELQAKRDDISVQEQALDFIRNILNGEDCAFMIEQLLRTIGHEKLFGLLTDKLAPIAPSAIQRSGAPSSGNVYQPTGIVLNTAHVLNHISNGTPTHKGLLIAQRQLLNNWVPHFHHPDRRVRVISAWAVISLTWMEDESDREAASTRAIQLRKAGIDGAIRDLALDMDLDVRERAKTACRQLDVL